MTKQPSSPNRSGFRSLISETSLREIFSIDLRALAVLRMAVGGLILVDLGDRLKLFEFFHGDGGFLNDGVSQIFAPPQSGFWSLYWLSDSPVFAWMLMALAALAAIGMILGCRSREMTIVSLVLFWSLNVGNPLVTTAGHILLRMLLFWMVWLPVGAVWSLDNFHRRRNKPDDVAAQTKCAFSLATVGIMLQVASMYFFPGIAKWNEEWLGGSALERALQLDMYVKPIGHWLADYPAIMMTATLATVLFEIIGPLLLFMPYGNRFWRTLFFLFFAGMHIGIWLTMSIGIFSIVAITSWIVFLPAEIWRPNKKTAVESNDPDATVNSQDKTRNRLVGLPRWANFVCGLFLVYVIAINVANIWPDKSRQWFPSWARNAGNVAMMTQEFKMFSRSSPETMWFELTVVGDNESTRTSLIEPLGKNINFALLDSNTIYRQARSQHFRRLLFGLITLRPREGETAADDAALIARLRERFARRWVDLIRSESPSSEIALDTTDPSELTYRLVCWRRTIDLEFPNRQPRREIWAEFQQ